MAKLKASKKEGSESRLDILRRKLLLEQEMIESGKSTGSKELQEINKKLEHKSQKESKETEKVEIFSEPKQPELEDPDMNKIAKTNSKSTLAEMQSDEPSEDEMIDKIQNVITEKSEDTVDLFSISKKKLASKVKLYNVLFDKIRKEVSKVVVGQSEIVNGLLRALIADGHVLLEGVPGIAKTTLIRTLAQTVNCAFGRIQFTPDLLPTDIIGISTYQEGRGFYTLKGPIFNNFILADEINRAPPKVQSALLEAMAEKQATIAKESFMVPLPFFTMATQNPIENVGTYALPEAQMDRFLFKLYMGYPDLKEEQEILRTNISVKKFDDFKVKSFLDPDSIVQIQNDTNLIYVDKKVEKYIVKIVDSTRNPKKYGVNLGKYVEYGSSPRGSIGLFKSARADALMSGQTYVTPHNVKKIAYDVLRHRIILSYEGQAEGIKSDQVITEILRKVPVL